jgi:hypothetical protein
MNVQRHIMDPLHVINALDLNHEHEAFAQWQMAIPGAGAGLATTEPLSHQNNTATVNIGPPGIILPLPDYYSSMIILSIIQLPWVNLKANSPQNNSQISRRILTVRLSFFLLVLLIPYSHSFS